MVSIMLRPILLLLFLARLLVMSLERSITHVLLCLLSLLIVNSFETMSSLFMWLVCICMLPLKLALVLLLLLLHMRLLAQVLLLSCLLPLLSVLLLHRLL